MFDAITSVLPHVQSGRLHALAVTSARRVDALADIPTVAETVPGYEVSGVLGVGAPKSTPVEIVDRLNREINVIRSRPHIAGAARRPRKHGVRQHPC